MRVLLDPVLTADPAKCSTTIQFAEFVRRTLEVEQRRDVFFYWVVPEHVSEERFAFYPQHPQVRYLRMPRPKDRIRDYIQTSREFEDAIAFNGDFWDFDVLLTVRAGLVPLFRLVMNSPRTRNQFWTKQVWLIEDMPMVSFKETVPNLVPEVHDRWTIEGHLAADRVWSAAYHEKPGIIRAAQRHFAPSLVRDLSKKIECVVTSQFERYELKAPEQMFRADGDQPFGVAYIGRMEKANNIDDIADAMEKAWIPRGDKVRMLVCTVSEVIRTFDEKIVDVRTPNREEFWKIVQDEMHVFIKMPKGGGFSLSLIEPLMLGTPVLTVRSEMYESLLGKDYPFFAEGPAQIPGLLKALFDDYAGQYARFARWQKEWFEPTYRRRMAEDLLYDKLSRAIDDFKGMLDARRSSLQGLAENDLVLQLAEHMQGGDKTVFQAIAELGEAGKVDRIITQKLAPGFRHGWNITFSTPWQPYRLGLMLFHGYEDASTEVGHLRRTA